MYEHRSERLLSRPAFLRRQFVHGAAATGIIFLALAVGAAGYHVFEHQNGIDSVYSAAMILTGMGPAIDVKTDAGKVFASVYALFSGVVFLSAASVILAPFVHRLLHRLHVEEPGD
jgi:hypothetical protein